MELWNTLHIQDWTLNLGYLNMSITYTQSTEGHSKALLPALAISTSHQLMVASVLLSSWIWAANGGGNELLRRARTCMMSSNGNVEWRTRPFVPKEVSTSLNVGSIN